ncbi:CdaR family protein [Aureitalea marina]|uniref:YbbR-like domain-containing protein n=1 Tax=Aureitalea marina TaxID=930804 RepID=A0A2S7KN19_9FLAO|nr:CdaR family protein [Aureitalea marina]PQB04027.1 hypothetical protein BST85_03260 [Aureitalea marina]
MSESSQFKKSRPRIFFLFLLLSFVFWMMARSSRENSSRMELALAYENVPENSTVSAVAPQFLVAEIRTTGFQSLFYKLKSPELKINVGVYAAPEDTLVVIGKEELRQMIGRQLGQDGELRYLAGEDLTIPLERIIRKRLPIVADIQLAFEKGFRPIGQPNVQPDSVTLTGPQKLMESIQEVRTQPIEGENINSNVQRNSQFVLPAGLQSDYSSQEVTVELNVSEFIEKQIQISPQIINLPPETEIRLIPETVKVTFDISVDQFNAVGPDDFVVICDFNERNDQENFMIPRIDQYPEMVQRVELADKKIDYLIFK